MQPPVIAFGSNASSVATEPFLQAISSPDRLLPGTPIAADPCSPGSTRTIFATGDLNHDGYTDLVAAHGFRKAGVYLNNRDQSFAPEVMLSEPWWPVSQNIGATSVALGHLDDDQNLDLVIPIYGSHFTGRQIQVYRGLGNGSFVPWPVGDGIITAGGAANPMFAGIADFNLDGRADIIVSANNGMHSVDILIQAANKSFSAVDLNYAGPNPQYFDLADFNHDGAPDLVVGALYTGLYVFINKADGSGGVDQLGEHYEPSRRPYVVAADFNADGNVDIAARGLTSPRVDLLLGDGSGVFTTTTSAQSSGVDGYFAAADMDRDGDPDLVVASMSSQSVDLLLNHGNGTFSAPISTPLDAAPWGLVVDDFNQDGWADVVVSRSDHTIQTLWNRGGVWVSHTTVTIPEHLANNSLINIVAASGQEPLSLALTSGNSDSDEDGQLAFAINSSTGAITVNDRDDLDYETTTHFVLGVTATDSSGLSGTGSVTIHLTDVDEQGNESPSAQDATFLLPEMSPDGTAVGQVIASDLDVGDVLTYTIAAGNTDPDGDGKAAFTIESATGAITVNDCGDLDFETMPSFVLSVTVMDVGGLIDTAAITINLSNIVEMDGTPGDDVLLGTIASDVLNGMAGDDTLRGGQGDDTFNGGSGIDELQEQGNLNFTLDDDQLTGLGMDTLISIERVSLTGGSGNNTLDASAFTRGAVSLNGRGGNDHLIGPRESGTWHWPAGLYANRFTGWLGNDTFTGGVGSDVIFETWDTNFTLLANQLTGNGTDTFSSMDIAYLVGGYRGNVLDASGFTGSLTILEGRGGNDTLIGGAAYDWVRSQANRNFTLTDSQLDDFTLDTLVRMDAAILIGGISANVLDVSAFTGNKVILEGGDGRDTLIGRPDGLDRVRARADVNFTLTDGELFGHGKDSLQHIDQAVVVGGVGANILDVSAFTGSLTILEGGGGDDTLIGRINGLDRVCVRGDVNLFATDTQLIGTGTDSLQHIDQAILIGDGGANTLDASTFTLGSVFLYGESGDDTLLGGKGNDHLEGGPGDDHLSGGLGRDQVVVRGDTDFSLSADRVSGLGIDTFDGMEVAHLIGGPGANSLDGSGFLGALVIYEGLGGDDHLIGRGTSGDRLRAVGDADFTLTNHQLTGLGLDSFEEIDQAQLIGYSGANRFDASAFSLGVVTIRAGGGNDTLIGGSANDYLSGGVGADCFRFTTSPNGSHNRDVISDFSIAQGDTIELVNSVFTALTTTGALATEVFLMGAAATTSAQRILYNEANGLLAYDTDGNGVAAAVPFAILQPGLELTSSQFSVS